MPSWRRTGYGILWLILCGMLGPVAHGQDAAPVQVSFVEDRAMQTASITDDGADGLTRLGGIFRQLGAETMLLRLDEAIPEDIDIVVLVRPKRQLRSAMILRLWQHLARGKHLLIAADPDNVAGVQSRFATSALNTLLSYDYGISANNDALLEPWFTLDQLSSVLNVGSSSSAENYIAHPIIAPPLQYDVPVQVWGARSLQVEAFGPDTLAWPLLFSETTYGESNGDALSARGDPPPPLELNIGEDNQGRLLLGSVALNTQTGSRVALLGDSEVLQNLYGLARVSGLSDVPRYPGDRILAERLAAWLMGLPEDSWPPLPEGLTWITLDGDDQDWGDAGILTSDPILDTPANDIRSVRAFSDDQYVYVLIEAYEIGPDPRLELRALDRTDLQYVVYSEGLFVHINPNRETTLLPDAEISLGDFVELRIPRRVLGAATDFEEICLGTLAMPQMDCMETPVPIQASNNLAPVPLGLPGLPSGSIINDANLRSGPSLDSQVQTTLPARTLLSILARDETGEWLLVRNGRWEGWVNVPLLLTNVEVENLPVVNS